MTGSELLQILDRATAHPSRAAFAVFVLIAVWRAATAPAPPAPPAAPEAMRRAVYDAIVDQERGLRERAEHNFPGDAWSQDDDFHAMEMQLARRLAAQRAMSLGDALRGVDDGLRDPAQARPNTEPKNSVPPCRPRPVY